MVFLTALRAFIAIRVPALPALTHVHGLVDSMHPPRGRRSPLRVVKLDNLHFTLRFLGEIDENRAEPLLEALKYAVSDASPFELELRGLGAFPSVERPSVVWVGVRHAVQLEALAACVEAAVSAAGFGSADRPFHPHLTVARCRARPPAALFDLLREQRRRSFGTFQVDRVELIASDLTPRGPLYRTVSVAPLAGGATPP